MFSSKRGVYAASIGLLSRRRVERVFGHDSLLTGSDFVESE